MVKYWLGVVSKEHVLRGVEGGFCQVCHGKSAPLKRMKKGDYLLYYSSKLKMDSPEKCQAFTAVGKMIDDGVYQVEMFPDFFPYRRNVSFYEPTKDGPIEVARLSEEWKTYVSLLRYGHFEISKTFFDFIFL